MTKNIESMKDDLCRWLHYRRDYLDNWKALNIRAVWQAENKKRVKQWEKLY